MDRAHMTCPDCGNEITIEPCVFCRYEAATRKLWKLAGLTLLFVAGMAAIIWGPTPDVQVLGGLIFWWGSGYSWGMK